MNPNLSAKALKTIESLCAQGCNQVNDVLDRAKKGQTVDELNGLSEDETDLVIEELGNIMSVYDDDIDFSTGIKPGIK